MLYVDEAEAIPVRTIDDSDTGAVLRQTLAVLHEQAQQTLVRSPHPVVGRHGQSQVQALSRSLE